jgi:RNA polymerase sigma-70 factor (ECF subfamily)
VVINHAISALRKLPRTEAVELEEYHARFAGDHDRIGMSMDLESALAMLGREDRAVVWLHDVEGYNHREIAGFFGKTESFSKTRLSRARARLREMLEPQTRRGKASGALA